MVRWKKKLLHLLIITTHLEDHDDCKVPYSYPSLNSFSSLTLAFYLMLSIYGIASILLFKLMWMSNNCQNYLLAHISHWIAQIVGVFRIGWFAKIMLELSIPTIISKAILLFRWSRLLMIFSKGLTDKF